MRIFLIRHGESTSDIENKYGGDYDDHLSRKGIKQAEELAQKIRDKKIEIIFTSPRLRASESAEILKNALDVPINPQNSFGIFGGPPLIKTIQNLRERNNYGFLTGINKEKAAKKYPKEVELLNDYHNTIQGAETYSNFRERIIKAWQEITATNYHTIAMVTHGGPIRCILREILKIGELTHLGDCAILELEKQGGKVFLVKMENAKTKAPQN